MASDYYNDGWLGQFQFDRIFSLGDFGAVRGTITADVFETQSGYKAIPISCKVIINGASWEWLHRLNATRREQIENEIATEVKNGRDDLLQV